MNEMVISLRKYIYSNCKLLNPHLWWLKPTQENFDDVTDPCHRNIRAYGCETIIKKN